MSNIEKLFNKIDSKTEEIKTKTGDNYLKALVKYLKLEDDNEYFEIVDNYSKEEIKKVYHFLVLKSFKELQNINYNVTPEIIGFYIANLVKEIYDDKKISVTDLASGSGTLLLSLAEKLNLETNFTSVDVDFDYASLQANIFNLLEQKVDIINQDGLKKINIPKQDVIVSDTPYGYYTDEDNSLNFKLCSEEGYSLNALLFLEQATNYLKDDGLAVLLMPKEIMNFDEKIKKFIEKDINFNAFIVLPEEMFKNKNQQRVIVLATKKGQTILPKQVFLAELPAYQNKNAYLNFISNFKKWLASK
ncbi:class I SAM-dependent methyltransferase [Gemella sp. zg-570]|uniref:class I SAM-dependent methyltransferase n=1 Tax=Gemella sp. zg-570 TaxID=2840371 RepID=UPI001C0E1564|nr:class I SAM-dependent methyltransferase [Gemella sp. zg-570]QWQ38274.1 class I SAM-dependent methyltransferase [Gemella sp. zg-570]